jgi:hypothetical protein
MNAARRAMKQLGTWHDLTSALPACGIGQALAAAEREIVHFHSQHDADLHLTRAVIQRLHPELSHSSAVRLLPGSAWVTLRLDCDADVALLVSLISVALQAHLGTRPHPDGAPCNLRHVVVTPSAGPASEPHRTDTTRKRPVLRLRRDRGGSPVRQTAWMPCLDLGISDRATPGAAVMTTKRISDNKAIDEVSERLRSRYAAAEPAKVDAAVKAAHDNLRNSRIRDFVPILVERQARATLDASGEQRRSDSA